MIQHRVASRYPRPIQKEIHNPLTGLANRLMGLREAGPSSAYCGAMLMVKLPVASMYSTILWCAGTWCTLPPFSCSRNVPWWLVTP